MSAITTHVLDTSTGRPAAGIEVHLEFQQDDDHWTFVGRGTTDTDGRLRTLLPSGAALVAGTYRLVFHTGAHFARSAAPTFYPHVIVVFHVISGESHYHVPLLLSPFGYSTYRGS
jgi:5-hydroxyisourate hydrolase